MLDDAQKKGYAVGSYNAINLDMIRGVLEAAEAEKSPVILCHAEVHLPFSPLEMVAPIMVTEARRAKVPVGLLLDHGKDFGVIVRAMALGMNGVMFDGSSLSYEDNVERSREVAKIAKPLGVFVEAELGHVTRPKTGGGGIGVDDDRMASDASTYTDPSKAKEFVEATGIDALAVAFGTAHGLTVRAPKLDLDRLAAVRDQARIPLVMHGGTGLSEEDFRESIRRGIAKINYYTGMAAAVADAFKAELSGATEQKYYHDLMMLAIGTIRDHVRPTMRLFGSSGRA
jgi:fructose-bisphosphate aldolase class II